MEEARLKQEKKNQAAVAIQEWQEQRARQTEHRTKDHVETEQQYQTRKEDERLGNQWARIIENCDLSMQGVTANGVDKTRMKEAMLNRKHDNIRQ